MASKQALLSWNDACTARQLFEAMQHSGFVTIQEVFDAWPGEADRQQLMRLSGGTGQLAWPEFRAAVRLWRSLPAHRPPSLQRYTLQSVAETSAGTMVSLIAAEAACFVVTNIGIDSPHLVNLGGFGTMLALLPLDSSSMLPQLQSDDVGLHALVNLGPMARFCIYLLGSASLGVMLSPASPLLSATVGDPKSRGHGPLAVAALSALQLLGFATTLSVLPKSEGTSAPRSANCCASVGGSLSAVALGLLAAHVMERPGSEKPILLAGWHCCCKACALLSWRFVHICLANRSHSGPH